MNHTWQIIKEQPDFDQWLFYIKGIVAVDVETKGQRPKQEGSYLLGTAVTGQLSNGKYSSIYTLPNINIKDIWANCKVVGWNVPFDKSWLDHHYKVDTKWHADGRIMWHLQNNDPAIRGYGLKLAQQKLLGWETTNEKELEENVKIKGGSLKKGDHYLADLDILAKYACLDTLSTLLCYKQLDSFMDKNSYWEFASSILEYSILLNRAAQKGITVDEQKLLSAQHRYLIKREEAGIELRKSCEKEISAIEDSWKTKKAASFKRDSNKQRYLDSPGIHRRFNPSSSTQRALLLHTMLEFPVFERTETGLPKTDRANISLVRHPGASALLTYSECKKVAEQAETYLKHTVDSRLYTNYDVCGTVSGRLSGFKPSLLNMPFSEDEVMSAFICEDGYVGVHADLAAIEPCVLAHYSDDPTLLKVYKQGMGDIYLDLALDTFPDNIEVKEGYNPNVPITKEVKERFKDLRAVCKIIHLAVSYTGTYITVAKNLSKNGFPTNRGEAMALVKRYWAKFKMVKTFDTRLKEIYRDKEHIRNLCGRIIQVPTIYEKDLMNRLVQSSAHDLLREWVVEIIKEFNIRNVQWKHWLPDLHDSTTFQVKIGQEKLAEHIYRQSLYTVAERYNLSVPLKMEFKTCTTLAGIKGND